MGLFNWFRKRIRATVADDKVWLSEESKLRGIGRDIADGLNADEFVIVVSHFPKSLRKLSAILENTSLNFAVFQHSLSSDEVIRRASRREDSCVMLVLSHYVPSDDRGDWQESHSGNVLIIVTERHPQPDPDEAIQRFAETLPFPSRIVFHVSLEDVLLKRVAGEWVGATLQKLGMSETEAVSSRMVTNRLKDAQQKVAQSSFGNEPADSAEEWFQQNCPNVM